MGIGKPIWKKKSQQYGSAYACIIEPIPADIRLNFLNK